MPYTVNFSTVGVPERRMRAVVTRLLQLASLFAERESRIGAQEVRDTGAMARSITSEVRGMTARVYSPLAYTSVVDQGRRPGAAMPPPAALEGWLQRHGLDVGLAWVIARAIGRRGIVGRFFYRRAAERLREAMPQLFDQALREAPP